MLPLIIIPTYNEAENIPRLLPEIWHHLPATHILVIDDASTDGTANIIKSHHSYRDQLHLIERPSKLGLGTAYVAGFRWALQHDYSHIFEMDADFSHDPRELPGFIDRIEKGADLVLGSRYINGVRVLNWPISRLFLSLGAAQYVKIITGMPYSDPTGGYKCFRRRVLEAISLDGIRSNGYSFQIEMTYKAWSLGFRIDEHPIIFEDRHSGTSKMSGAIAREAYTMVWKIAAQNRFRRTPAESPL